MIKKLRRRFILILLTIMTVFVIGVTASIFILMYRSEVSQSSDIMDQALNLGGFERSGFTGTRPQKGEFPLRNNDDSDNNLKYPPDGQKGDPFGAGSGSAPNIPEPDRRFTEKENNMLRNCFVVSVDINGSFSVQYQISATVTNEEIQAALDKIQESSDSSGVIEISGIEYRYKYRGNGKSASTYVFLDRSIEKTTLRNLMLILLIIGCGSIGIMFVISLFLSCWAVGPINEAWEKQKQFVADASHELKTPLTIIEANADVVLANPTDTVRQQEKWLNYIKSETQRMTKLVQNLLYIARVDSAREKAIMESFDISEAITGVCLVCESMIFENGKLLETDIAPDLRIKGDKEKLVQLVTILIDNAVKHSDEGSTIYVALLSDKQKGKVRMIVANSGENIPAEAREKIFERFYRVDKSRARSTGGSGLGLSIAKSIVDSHNGTIQVISNPGELTRFIVVL